MVNLDIPSPLVIQQANAIKKAMVEIQKLQAKHQVIDALNMCNRLKTDAIYDLPPNSPVLV
jgi:hypothetical protein